MPHGRPNALLQGARDLVARCALLLRLVRLEIAWQAIAAQPVFVSYLVFFFS